MNPISRSQTTQNRRDFLRKTALCSFASTSSAWSWAHGQSSSGPRRLILISYPNGAVLRKWHLNQSSGGGSFNPTELSFALQPLAEHANLLYPLRHLNTLGHGGSSSHPEAASQILSGGLRNRPSVDVEIATALSSPTPLAIAHLGLFTRYNKGEDHLMFRGTDGRPVLPEDDPVAAARLLFGEATGAGPRHLVSPDSNSRTERQLRILTRLEEAYARALPGPNEFPQVHEKITTHQQSLSTYRRILSERGGSGSCTSPSDLMAMGPDRRANNLVAEHLVRSQWKNIVAAAACDICRVFSFSFMSAQDDSLHINFESLRELLDAADGGGFGSEKKWWNQTQSHSSSHEANEVFAIQTRWYNMMISQLVSLLKSTPDSQSGSPLMDNTLIAVVSENGESAYHGQEDVPWYLLAGSRCGLGPARVLDCGRRGSSDLLLALAQIMGLSWESYGRSNGGLPQLGLFQSSPESG